MRTSSAVDIFSAGLAVDIFAELATPFGSSGARQVLRLAAKPAGQCVQLLRTTTAAYDYGCVLLRLRMTTNTTTTTAIITDAYFYRYIPAQPLLSLRLRLRIRAFLRMTLQFIAILLWMTPSVGLCSETA